MCLPLGHFYLASHRWWDLLWPCTDLGRECWYCLYEERVGVFFIPEGSISTFPDLVLISKWKFLCIYFFGVYSHVSSICDFPVKYFSPGQMQLYCCVLMLARSHFQLASECVWWCLMQNGWLCYCTVFCSACMSQKSQGDGRGLSGFFVLFTCHCRVILFHLPPLITQQLWEKRSGWAFKALSSSWELCLSLACCCTSQSWERGSRGCFMCRKINLSPCWQK